MAKIIILGSGLVGRTIVTDLCGRHQVTAADIDAARLVNLSIDLPVSSLQCDFSDFEGLKRHLKQFDLVISAVPGFLGFKVLQAIIEAGKNVVDISFFPQDPFELDQLAKKKGVTAIVDCGVAPGMCNMIAGFHNRNSKLIRYKCMVGGLPEVREWPFEYKAVFSPADVIEEYVRPVRLIRNGKIITKPALSEVEQIELDGVDTLEAFNSDGLRTLLKTMPHAASMEEKTLRYPGHANLMKIFRESGFFNAALIDLDAQKISPLSLTSKLLFSKWEMKKGDKDFTVMQVEIENEDGQWKYYLLDKYCEESHTTSMSRTTAYTATAASELVLNGRFKRRGICPPEFIGESKNCLQFVFDYQAERGVHYKKTFKKKKQKSKHEGVLLHNGD